MKMDACGSPKASTMKIHEKWFFVKNTEKVSAFVIFFSGFYTNYCKKYAFALVYFPSQSVDTGRHLIELILILNILRFARMRKTSPPSG